MLVGILGITFESIQNLAPILSLSARFVAAIAVVIFGYIFGRGAGKFVQSGVNAWNLNGLIEEHHLDQIAGSFVKYLIYIAALIIALNQIGLALNILNSIFIVLLIVVAIGLFLGIKDFIPNIMAGVYVAYKKRIKVGQYIRVQDVEGIVIKIELVETKLLTKSGHEVVIPNSFFVKNVVHVKPKKKATKTKRPVTKRKVVKKKKK